MFTKNWYKAASAAVVIGCDCNYTGVTGDTHNVIPDYAATAIRLTNAGDFAQSSNVKKLRTDYTSGGGVILGTGTIPPTVDDYKLSGDLISGFQYASSYTTATDENGTTLEVLYTITNTSGSDFTIGEIAVMASIQSSNQAASHKALLERTVLDSPITIPAGGVGQVTYTIRMNYPTA